ncbi:hypothetical protein FNV43_RR08619 [Rhamnella rubrinervis]|uniref:AAA+ ATPase domain-containing protein n=1 Tax=Rhamnella rubrinervis TaxID=2594499 RepID=A0A8K0H8N0_9ROSA|nr:hypothetical protein FNV43_RR08619 [Rhamnella rubrinervis]
MDRILQIGGNIADFAIEQVVRQLRYVIDYESNLDNIKGQLEDFVDFKGRVEHKVDEALSKSQKIEADVGKWLKRVEDIIAQAPKLLEDENHACVFTGCGEGFPSVAYIAPLQRTLTVVKGFQAFESRTSIVSQILEEFKKDDMNMIGVYGMAGVGKSTFAKQVANQARVKRLFDNVGEAEVKQNPDVKSIQNKLELSLGLHLDKTQTIDEWQLTLRNYIKDMKKKILIILDDIWEMLDLKTLGLEEGYCKILLTSRDGEMLRSEMGTQKNFRLDILDETETWSLFEKKVSDAVKHPDIREVATRIAKRCGGLPILVETIARILRGKPIHSWNDALMRLNRSDGKGLQEKVHWGIEWSCNQLGDEDVKSLFLIGVIVDKLKESCLLLDTNDCQTFMMHDLTLDVARNIASRGQHFLSFGYKNEFMEWPNKELLHRCAMMSINRINISKLPEELECQGLHLFKISSKDKSLQIPPNSFKDTKQLRVLDLSNPCIPSLTPSIQSLTSLQTLCLDQCELRDTAIVGELRNLEILKVVNCNNMKEIIVGEKEKQWAVEADHPIEFHGLQSLSMRGLPELTSFASNSKLHETSTSNDPLHLFNDMVVFPKLEYLKLSSIPLNKLWDGHFSERTSWIQNLTSLIVDGCDGLSFLCSSSVAINFVQLKKPLIRSCQNMVWIILTEEALENLENMFPKLQTLQLLSLGQLEIFCTSPTYIEFPCLDVLVIKDCTKLGSFIIDSARRKNVTDPAGHHLFNEYVGFPNLDDLRMEGLHKLTTIWHTQLATDSFYKLTFIWVNSCPNLIHIIGPGILKRLHSLKELYIKDCESVQEVFNGDDDQSEVFTYQNLLQVVIRDCRSLKIVFPAQVARVLVKLEKLLISDCKILKIIVGEEDQIIGEIIPNFVFPRVKTLGLWRLPQLRNFYPGMHTSLWPSLRELWLRPSDEVEKLAEEYSIFQQQQQQHENDQLGAPTKLPILLFQKGSFRHLEEFHFARTHGIELPLEFLETKRLCGHLKIASIVGLPIILKKFHILQQLEFFFGYMEEIFINGGVLDGEEQHVFAHLKSLRLYGMDSLIHLWKDNSHLAGPVFPNLEILEVEKCGRLKTVVSSAISFCNLVQLEVLDCHGLKHLFTCSVAKSLVQLQSIIVKDCSE